MNPSNRRSRRRRSPRPFALLLIIGGAALLGYNLWPADGSNLLQAEPKAEAKSKPQVKPTRVPSTVAVNDQTPATEPVVEKPTEASTPKALPEVVEVQSPEPTPLQTCQPIQSPRSRATPTPPRPYGNVLSPTLRPACGCCEMGLELKGGNACLMPLVREDLIMPEQVRFARSCLNFQRRWFLVLVLPNEIPLLVNSSFPKGACWPKLPRIRPMVCTGSSWHESMGSPVQIAFDLANA